ncbi:MAG: sulfurtransferase [Sandaracinaceae bacterium]|nr:sulfurtransferase [Sandaracinaceae bacterium]
MQTPILSAAALAQLGGARVLDARSGDKGRSAYAQLHLRGALHVDLERDLSGDPAHPERGGRHPLPSIDAWARTLGRLGVDPETFVVIYDDQGGANAAARAWWMLRAVGHEKVAVVDGGWDAIVRAGAPLDVVVPGVEAKPPYPVKSWLRSTVTIDEVAALAHDPAWLLVDVRAPERYRGESESLDPIAGHVPGAVNLPLKDNLRADGTFKAPSELRAQYDAARGGVPVEHLILSCGSGVTACHTLLALEHAGLHGASLYVGSWSEWCRSGKPLARGPARG